MPPTDHPQDLHSLQGSGPGTPFQGKQGRWQRAFHPGASARLGQSVLCETQ